MSDPVDAGTPAEEHNTDTGETVRHDVTIVTHPASGNLEETRHGWTAPQLEAARAGRLTVGCAACRVALDLPDASA